MKYLWNVIAGVLIVVGIIWFVQGVGVLTGSFMSGRIQWAIIGAISILLGTGLLIYLRGREAR